jgi:hypothetical protein
MRYISHRGNIDGINPLRENNQEYIDQALSQGFDVEIDLWIVEGELYLGHDEPKTPISLDWILDRQNNLWLHCKNTQVVSYLSSLNFDLNYFWHQEDTLTLTSKKFIWVFPGKQPIDGSIAVLPELYDDDFSKCFGICSDFVKIYRDGSKPLNNLRD